MKYDRCVTAAKKVRESILELIKEYDSVAGDSDPQAFLEMAAEQFNCDGLGLEEGEDELEQKIRAAILGK